MTRLPLRPLAAVLLAGALLTAAAPTPAWQALGLGLLLPGGGFLLGSHWLLAALTALATGAGLATARRGGLLWPAAAWLAGAAWAAEHAATAGTCELLGLAGYTYAFSYWAPALVLVPALAATAATALLAARYRHSGQFTKQRRAR